MGVDREHREKLIQAIDSYLHEEFTAFDFDDTICEIRDRTTDETVKRVIDLLWYFYDDCDDHKVVLDRVGWNYFQRLRLLLNSDATLESSKKRVWSTAQIIAAADLAAFVWVACQTGVGEHLMLVAIPFGILSICLSQWRAHLYRKACDWDVSLHPFTSVGQLLWVGHDVPGFRKDRYPLHLTSRRIRDGRSAFVVGVQMYVPWLLFSPVALLAQLFPLSIPVRRVVP